ncbi:MAG: hypothetical protein ACTS5I_15755 [Rhodanobacter sp.]
MRTRLLGGLMVAGLLLLVWRMVPNGMDSGATTSTQPGEIEVQPKSASPHERVERSVAFAEPAIVHRTLGEDEEKWRRLCAEPDSPGRRDRMAATIEVLVKRDPAMARSFALRETDPELRAHLLDVMMRRWAQYDFAAAARWARSQSGLTKERMLVALFIGGSESPETIIAFARTISREEPGQAKDVGSYLIQALGRAGNHESAADYAAEGDGETHDDWLVSAYSRWGYQNPETAVLHAIGLADPQKRQHAFRAAATGWAQTDPQALLESARTFPDGPEKTFSMTVALREWAEQDAAAVARWVSNNQR